jgi:hypothetical protein
VGGVANVHKVFKHVCKKNDALKIESTGLSVFEYTKLTYKINGVSTYDFFAARFAIADGQTIGLPRT